MKKEEEYYGDYLGTAAGGVPPPPFGTLYELATTFGCAYPLDDKANWK